MKLAIIGGRDFVNYDAAREKFLKYFCNGERCIVDLIVSGGARGADSIGEALAEEFGIETKIFLPDWDTFGKRAGFLRNKDIIENCEMVLAFWTGISKGTGNSLSHAKKMKKDTFIVYY